MTQTRVLVIHPGAELYGSDRMMLRSVRALARAGAHVDVIVPSDGPLVREIESIPRSEAHRFPRLFVLRKREVAGAPAKALLHLVRSWVPTLRLIRGSRADTVYITGITTPVALLAAWFARTRVVVHVHEAETDLSTFRRWLLGAPLLLSDNVLAASQAVAQSVSASQPRLAARTRVVLNAVAPSDRGSPLPSSPPDPVHLVLVGRWSWRKGLDAAIEAAAQVRRAGVEPRLRLVGSVFPGYEDYQREIERLVWDLGLSDCVEFVAFQPNPVLQYEWSHLVLVPSRTGEAFGLVAAEGQLAERFVIASRIGGLPEIVQAGVTGALVEPGDPEALARAILEARSTWSTTQTIARQGRRQALERFSEARYEQELLAAVLRS